MPKPLYKIACRAEHWKAASGLAEDLGQVLVAHPIRLETDKIEIHQKAYALCGLYRKHGLQMQWVRLESVRGGHTYLELEDEEAHVSVGVEIDAPPISSEEESLVHRLGRHMHRVWSVWVRNVLHLAVANKGEIPEIVVEEWGKHSKLEYEDLPPDARQADQQQARMLLGVLEEHLGVRLLQLDGILSKYKQGHRRCDRCHLWKIHDDFHAFCSGSICSTCTVIEVDGPFSRGANTVWRKFSELRQQGKKLPLNRITVFMELAHILATRGATRKKLLLRLLRPRFEASPRFAAQGGSGGDELAGALEYLISQGWVTTSETGKRLGPVSPSGSYELCRFRELLYKVKQDKKHSEEHGEDSWFEDLA